MRLLQSRKKILNRKKLIWSAVLAVKKIPAKIKERAPAGLNYSIYSNKRRGAYSSIVVFKSYGIFSNMRRIGTSAVINFFVPSEALIRGRRLFE